MPRSASVTEVARHFSGFIDRVAHGGERFVLTRRGRPVAELRPVPVAPRLSELPAIFASLPRLEAGDAEAFARDAESFRRELDSVPPADPWAPPAR